MTKPANLAAITEATDLSWQEWTEYFTQHQAELLDHAAIAKLAYERIDATNENRGWWAQSVAVAYEQHIGRRQPGQVADGTYEVSVSKTLAGDMDDALATWDARTSGVKQFNDIELAESPTTSSTEKWRHWRARLKDGSRIEVSATDKAGGKSILTVTSQKLPDAATAERWRGFWKDYLSDVA